MNRRQSATINVCNRPQRTGFGGTGLRTTKW